MIIKTITERLFGSLIFYTTLPLGALPCRFDRIASFAPIVGVLLGLILGAVDWGLQGLNLEVLLRSALVVGLWLGLTGGLHLDGAMDTADGLGVTDPQRRLAVMSDSRSGAFAVMTAIVILLVKTTALGSLKANRCWGLCWAAGWGRWSQVVAIARYPYLKAEGKGRLHRQEMKQPQDWLLGLLVLLGVQGWGVWQNGGSSTLALLLLMTLSLSLGVPAYFQRQLGGQTGDSYGAIVEWTETLLLVALCIVEQIESLA
ncbi:MAG: adenosylcobinamide-GDP ribazoletransferase [Prochlorotrichaceae cyanobacterium]